MSSSSGVSLQNIVNSIMSKIPVHRLKHLRREMEIAKDGGLSLEEFISAATRNMELHNEDQLLQTIPELVDLFEVIDVNGDETLEWKEFVSFLIDQVVQMDRHEGNKERISTISNDATDTSFRDPVQCCKVYFGKLFVASGNEIHIFSLNVSSSSWIAEDSAKIVIEGPEAFENNLRQDDVRVLDFAFVESEDVLIILRSDKVLHSLRFTTRTKLTSDSIFFMGIAPLPRHCARIEVKDVPKETLKLFASGAGCTVDAWTIVLRPSGVVVFEEHQQLPLAHTDFIRDMLIISHGMHRLLITGALDRRWAAYDLLTLNLRYTRGGISTGIRCLAHDNKSLLLAGCFDHSIAAWDLNSELDIPLFVMMGHKACVVKVVALKSARCFSLDAAGELRYWDISMNDEEARFIHSKRRADDRFLSFGIFTNVEPHFDAMNNIVVAACGRLTHIYKVVDSSPVEEPPFAVLFSYELLTIITVHPSDIFLWNAVNGDLIHRISNDTGRLAAEITCAVLNSKSQKLLCGDTAGTVSVYNCFNGVLISSLVVSSSTVRLMNYCPDKTLLVLCGQNELIAVDESDDFTEISVLRVNRIHDRYIVSMSYSPALGIVALADAADSVFLIDYQFFSLELTIGEVTGSKICLLHFIEDFPLLLVCNNMGSFVVIPVELDALRHPIWRVAVIIEEAPPQPHQFTHHQMTQYMKSKSHVSSVASFVNRINVDPVEESVYSVKLRKSIGSFAMDMEKLLAALDAPTEQFTVEVVVSYEDGVVAVFDFDYALQSTNRRRIPPSRWACTKENYNSRRRVERGTAAYGIARTSLIKSTLKRAQRRTQCSLLRMWRGHSAGPVSVATMRHNRYLLTASEDRHVQFWSIEGLLKGTLTRGTKADQVLPLMWASPVDMASRAREKHELAVFLRNKLNLFPTYFKSRDHGQSRHISINLSFANPLLSSVGEGSMIQMIPSDSMCELGEYPDRVRVIGQLRGEVTYKQSTKDLHRTTVGSPATQMRKSMEAMEQQVKDEKDKKRGRRARRRRRVSGSAALVVLAADEDAEYMESIMQKTTLGGGDEADLHASLSTKTRFDAEIQRFDAVDPLNWDISSNNRQRRIYSNLHKELTAKGISNDRILKLDTKLDVMSPGGSFKDYLQELRHEAAAYRELSSTASTTNNGGIL